MQKETHAHRVKLLQRQIHTDNLKFKNQKIKSVLTNGNELKVDKMNTILVKIAQKNRQSHQFMAKKRFADLNGVLGKSHMH